MPLTPKEELELIEIEIALKEKEGKEQPKSTKGGLKEVAKNALKQSPLSQTLEAGKSVMEGASNVTEALGNISPIQVPEKLQQTMEPIVNTPRAAGVTMANMAENALVPSPTNIQNAVGRGKEALSNEFQPNSPIEATGAAVGEAAAPVAATVGMGPMGAGLSLGALSAAQSIGRDGEIKPVLTTAAIMAPAVLNKGIKIAQNISKNRSIIDAEKFLTQQADDLSTEFNKFSDDITKSHSKLREKLKINETPAEIEQRIKTFPQTNGQMSPNDVLTRLNFIRDKMSTFTPTDKLKQLSVLDRQINQHINWKNPSDSLEALTLKNSIRAELRKLGTEGNVLVKANEVYSNYLRIANQLKDKLETPELSSALLKRLAKGEVKKSFSVSAAKELKALKRLEKEIGKDILGPVTKRFPEIEAAQKGEGGRGVFKSALGIISPRSMHALEALESLARARKK